MKFCLYFVLFWSTQTAAFAVSADEERRANLAVAAGHYTEARTIFETLASQHPDRIDYAIWIGRLDGWLGNYAAALEVFDTVLRLNPDNIEALLGKAYVLLWQHRYPEADAILRNSEALQPANPEVSLAWAKRFYYDGKPRTAARYLSEALRVDPRNQDALQLRGELVEPDSVEMVLSYGLDRFSFASKGQSGAVAASWLLSRGNAGVRYEEWNRFGKRATRAGFGGSLNLTPRWTLWATSLLGSDGAVFAAQDHSLGFGRRFSSRLILGGQYRYLKFDQAKVKIAAPSLEYYFGKSSWLSATAAWSTTSYLGQYRTSDGSGAFRIIYHQGLTPRLSMLGGYALGSESFSDLSFDRLGHFVANTYIGGSEFQMTRHLRAAVDCLWMQRSTGANQQSLNLRLVVRK